MKTLLTFAFCLLSFVVYGAYPPFKGFYGAGGIVITTNQTLGTVIVDGSAITSATNTPSSSTNAIGAPVTNMLWGRTIFVDATHGNNATAIRGDASKPYLSASNAIAAVQSGDTVLFRPGTYTVPTVADGWRTNGTLKIYGKTNVIIAGMTGARLQAGGLGSMFAVGFVTNLIFQDIEMVGVLTNNVSTDQSGAVWIEGRSKHIQFNRVNINNWQNQGIITFRHPDTGWDGYQWMSVKDSRLWQIGFTNSFGALPNDGTAIVFCGDDVEISGNSFGPDNLRDFETFNQDTFPQIWRRYIISNNRSYGAKNEFIAQGATNVQDWVIFGNTVKMFETNKVLGLNQVAIHFIGGKNILIYGNEIDGGGVGIMQHSQAIGPIDGLTIKNNVIQNQYLYGISMWRESALGHAPKRVFIEDNKFINIEQFGIYGQFTDGTIDNNTFVDVGFDSGFTYSPIYFGAQGLGSTCTNTVITRNKFLKSGDLAYTALSIEVGSSAYNTRIFGNKIGPGVAAMVNNGNNTDGLLGDGWNDYIGGIGVGSVWLRTNASGMGTWGILSNFSDINITNFLTVSNIKTVYLTVTNIASFSNTVWRAAESDWTMWAHGLSENLYLDNNGYGRWLEFDATTHGGPLFHKPVFVTNLTVFGPQTNNSSLYVNSGGGFVARPGAHFLDEDFTGDKMLISSGSEIVESSIGVGGSPEGLMVPGAVNAGSATITNQIIVGNALTNSPFIVKNGGTNVGEITTNGNFLAWAGTVSKPAFGWMADDDAAGTGLYRSAANQIGFSVNGGAIGIMYSAGLSLGFPLQFGAAASSPDTEIKRIASGVVGVGTTNIYLRDVTVTNNIGYQVGTVSGVGGANTNFTLQAAADESIIYVDAGTTNVNLVAIMGYSSTIAYRGTVILTNRTATPRTLSLGATTNNWISLQQFDGITAPFTITNSLAGRFSWEILGTNVQYSFKPMALPSN